MKSILIILFLLMAHATADSINELTGTFDVKESIAPKSSESKEDLDALDAKNDRLPASVIKDKEEESITDLTGTFD